jgi:hypothetical protein
VLGLISTPSREPCAIGDDDRLRRIAVRWSRLSSSRSVGRG